MSDCVDCHSGETRLFRGDDGHFRKECSDCGYVGGPYVSNQTTSASTDATTRIDETEAQSHTIEQPETTDQDTEQQGTQGQSSVTDWV